MIFLISSRYINYSFYFFPLFHPAKHQRKTNILLFFFFPFSIYTDKCKIANFFYFLFTNFLTTTKQNKEMSMVKLTHSVLMISFCETTESNRMGQWKKTSNTLRTYVFSIYILVLRYHHSHFHNSIVS